MDLERAQEASEESRAPVLSQRRRSSEVSLTVFVVPVLAAAAGDPSLADAVA
jgi:hypothetical protein